MALLPPHPIGANRLNANAFARRWPAATRRCSIPQGEIRFLLVIDDSETLAQQLRVARLERAIGVIYRPETERQSHYFPARLAEQFDAVLHFDETRAVKPLETTAEWEAGELPETFPFAV
jgi:Erythromycin esterase